MNEHGYYGIQGIDWFLTRNNQDSMQVSVVELNSRPTANTPPLIIAEKLGAPHWINTNVYTDRPIRNIKDYIDIIGTDYAFGQPTKLGMVIPQAFRTLVRRDEIKASPNFKTIILGRDPIHCRQIVQVLSTRGIRFNP